MRRAHQLVILPFNKALKGSTVMDTSRSLRSDRSAAPYSPGPLGRNEVSLRSFARRIRDLIPESSLERAPTAGWAQGHESSPSRG
jgi:hypothetical protein